MRSCVDYRKLNAVPPRDWYFLPTMEEYIVSLRDAQIRSFLDVHTGYGQVDVHPSDREKATCPSHYGFYKFTRMVFGLKNDTATFQHLLKPIYCPQSSEDLPFFTLMT